MKSVRILNGYRVIYEPSHPTAMTSGNWKGYIYEHKYLMEKQLGRPLKDDEVVHHLDCNPSNNRLDNLLVLTRNMHAKLHIWIDSGAFIHEVHKKGGLNSAKQKVIIPSYCCNCGRTLQAKQNKVCSVECRSILQTTSTKPTKEQLKEDMEDLSWVAIGRKYNVSDNAVRKWAKKIWTVVRLTI